MGFYRPRFGTREPLEDRIVICDECLALVFKNESYGHDLWHADQRERFLNYGLNKNDDKDNDKKQPNQVHDEPPLA